MSEDFDFATVFTNLLLLSLTFSQYLFTAALKGFGLSFASHYLIEGNQPATFHHPVMSVMADHQMCIDLVTMKLRMW